MEREIQDRDLQLKRLQEDIQLEFNERQNEVLERMSVKIQEIINEYAPQNGFGVIFLRNEAQTFVDNSLDITPDIVRIYNERNPVGGQGASQ
jgi:Skp family chaperone for outer membrane proteins